MFSYAINKNKRINKRGFTIIEALVAFSILVIAFGAFISSTTTTIKSFSYAEDAHLANKMSKEGIELVINKKFNHIECIQDHHCTDVSDWRDNLDVGTYVVSSARPAELLPGNKFRGAISVDASRPLCFLNNTGKFGYCEPPDLVSPTDGDGRIIPGDFSRVIVIEDLHSDPDFTPDNPEGIRVKSIVRWGGNKEVVLETLLYKRF